MAKQMELFGVQYKEGSLGLRQRSLSNSPSTWPSGTSTAPSSTWTGRASAAPAKMKSGKRWPMPCGRLPPRCATSPRKSFQSNH